ncbi:ABC transporter substrate-binding protein [Azospirillum sp. ST 5-10]|uniref:ABC transporter substrate-binding protein n=1 Tax=unclassified Azospirillum TaxID=2630922 RepID=UPI003F49C0BB
MHRTLKGVLAAATVATVAAAAPVHAQDAIKVGGLATLEGAFAVMGQDSLRGLELALKESNYTAGGKTLELIKGSSDARPDTAIRAARKLVEQDGVQILIGPLSGSEGVAMRDYAKTQPTITFINGSSAAQDTTLQDPAPNFFRFSTDGVQWQAGLGGHAYGKGWKRAVVVAEDYSFPYSQVMGFMLDYCKAGGKVVEKYWVPIGNKDYSSIIAQMPDDIDAIYVALGGADAINFLSQYEQSGGDKPMIAGSITVDQTVLSSKGKRSDYLVGTPSAGPIADSWDNPKWKAFVAAYQKEYPDGLPSPSLFAHAYYLAGKAMIAGLEKVGGDLSDNQKSFQAALAKLELDTPTGKVTLDKNRQAVADIFLTEVDRAADGSLYNKVVEVIPQVPQTMGMPEAEFMKLGPPSRTNPECK